MIEQVLTKYLKYKKNKNELLEKSSFFVIKYLLYATLLSLDFLFMSCLIIPIAIDTMLNASQRIAPIEPTKML